MMKPKIVLVLPTRETREVLEATLERVGRTIKDLSHRFCFKIYIRDDSGPKDKNKSAYRFIEKWASECGLDVVTKRNSENEGLVETLKRLYEDVLGSEGDSHKKRWWIIWKS